MNDLLTQLEGRGVKAAISSIGLDYARLFGKGGELEQNPYAEHDWIVKNVPVYGFIINAVPKPEQLMESFWEEWFRKDGVTYHHALYLRKPDRWDEIFEAPDADDIHPPSTLGKRWYVVNDPDMSPVLLR